MLQLVCHRPKHGGRRGVNARQHNQRIDDAKTRNQLIRHIHRRHRFVMQHRQISRDAKAHHQCRQRKGKAAQRAAPFTFCLTVKHAADTREERHQRKAAKGGVVDARKPPERCCFGHAVGLVGRRRLQNALWVLYKAAHADQQRHKDDHRTNAANNVGEFFQPQQHGAKRKQQHQRATRPLWQAVILV
ncbi:hypothetical protein SDC9_96288 [bioreactor metagenome]|uniref:Uncharacterized protein n=1 Tax=bioreactor metagenome TaxID=1076179 RepID=A0A645AA25_9ZZZZ